MTKKKWKSFKTSVRRVQACDVTHALTDHILPLLENSDDVIRLTVHVMRNRPRVIHTDQLLVNIIKE